MKNNVKKNAKNNVKRNIKKNVKRRLSKKKIILFFLKITALFAIIITIILNITNTDKKKEETKEVSKIYDIEENQNRKIDDWKLALINKQNYLPEDYVVDLVEIQNGHEIDKRIETSLNNMLEDMRKEGLQPLICAAYRSAAMQQKLFNNKVEYYKNQGNVEKKAREKASYWIAVPGTSEHEAGLSVDIVSKNYQLLDENQEKTPEQKWLMENCYEYGFIMRYPIQKKEITKIDYEPWHYRYVGVENAKVIKEKNFCLEEYIEHLSSGN